MLLSAILMLALTRAEIVERFKAPVLTKVNGLVQVFADCPQDIRREFQMPVADFAADVCRKLEAKEGMKSPRFAEPGIVVYVGEERTNRADVVVRRQRRGDGAAFTRIYLPAPGFTDVERFRLEVAKAFYRSAKGVELDDEEARAAIVASDLGLKVADEYERLGEWLSGGGPHHVFRIAEGGDAADKIDENYLKLARSVILPGVARRVDVLRFASRLRIYPAYFDTPIAGRYRDCSFADAIDLAAVDPRIRLMAYDKAPLVAAYGGGRSEELAAAAAAYSEFLLDLVRYKKSREELHDQLEAADTLLNVALERAREEEQGGRWR